MSTTLHLIKGTVFLLGIALIALSWVGYFVFAFRMIKGRREGINPWGPKTAWNAFNLCFLPSLLTENGKKARQWFFLSAIGFLLGFALIWLVKPI